MTNTINLDAQSMDGGCGGSSEMADYSNPIKFPKPAVLRFYFFVLETLLKSGDAQGSYQELQNIWDAINQAGETSTNSISIESDIILMEVVELLSYATPLTEAVDAEGYHIDWHIGKLLGYLSTLYGLDSLHAFVHNKTNLEQADALGNAMLSKQVILLEALLSVGRAEEAKQRLDGIWLLINHGADIFSKNGSILMALIDLRVYATYYTDYHASVEYGVRALIEYGIQRLLFGAATFPMSHVNHPISTHDASSESRKEDIVSNNAGNYLIPHANDMASSVQAWESNIHQGYVVPQHNTLDHPTDSDDQASRNSHDEMQAHQNSYSGPNALHIYHSAF